MKFQSVLISFDYCYGLHSIPGGMKQLEIDCHDEDGIIHDILVLTYDTESG